MEFTTAQIAAWVGTFVWPFLRIGALLMSVPVFSGRTMPVRLRLMLALLLTWAIALQLPTAPAVEPLSGEGLLTAVQQIGIGLLMGFMLQLVFAAVAFGGQLIAYSMGLGFASMVDPANGVQVPVISQYFIILVTLVFLLLDGHLVLFNLLADSFRTLPVGPAGLTSADLWSLVRWGSRMFSDGLLIALPAVVALLVVNLTFGVVTRAAPQLNIFAVGFPISMLLGFWILWATLPGVVENFTQLLDQGLLATRQLLQ